MTSILKCSYLTDDQYIRMVIQNEAATNEEMVDLLMLEIGLTREAADFYAAQRTKAETDSDYKLVHYSPDKAPEDRVFYLLELARAMIDLAVTNAQRDRVVWSKGYGAIRSIAWKCGLSIDHWTKELPHTWISPSGHTLSDRPVDYVSLTDDIKRKLKSSLFPCGGTKDEVKEVTDFLHGLSKSSIAHTKISV